MKANPADRNKAERSWRPVGEFSQPPGFQDEEWVVVGLMRALEGIDGLSPDLDRLTQAVVAAVKRAGGRRTSRAIMGQSLIVRVLISSTKEDRIASSGWGFFVVERASGGMDGADAELNHEGRQIGHCIELYLYTDGS